MSVFLLLLFLVSFVLAAPPACTQIVTCKFTTVNANKVQTQSGRTTQQCKDKCEDAGIGSCKAWQRFSDGTCQTTNDAAFNVVFDPTVQSGGCISGTKNKLDTTTSCAPVPVNCVLSAWSSYSTCSVTCGQGFKSRTRTIITQPSNGGSPCGPTYEQTACNGPTCPPNPPVPVNCVLSPWSGYSTCSVTCGQGIKSRARTIVVSPLNGGTPCGPTYEQTACNGPTCPPNPPVPVDCVLSPWSSFSSCSVTCGQGTKSRTRTIVTQPANGGTGCGDLTETVSCQDTECIISPGK